FNSNWGVRRLRSIAHRAILAIQGTGSMARYRWAGFALSWWRKARLARHPPGGTLTDRAAESRAGHFGIPSDRSPTRTVSGRSLGQLLSHHQPEGQSRQT